MEYHKRMIVIIIIYTEFLQNKLFSSHVGTEETVREEILLCFETILTQQLTDDDSLLFLIPSTEEKERNQFEMFKALIKNINGNSFIDKFLRTVHSRGLLKIQTIGTDYEEKTVYLTSPSVYVMLVIEETSNSESTIEVDKDEAGRLGKSGEEEEDEEDAIEELERLIEDQLLDLKNMVIWNARAKFILIVAMKKISKYSSNTVALQICRLLGNWNIINIVVMVPNFNNETFYSSAVDLFTWFPYNNGTCGEVENVVMVDQWINNTLREGSSFFPMKIPKKFNKCPIKIAALGIEPFIVSVDNYTHNKDNGNIYNFRGITAEYPLIALDRLNVTVHTEMVSNDVTFENILEVTGGLVGGKYDVLVGPMPWLAAALMVDLSFPTINLNVRFQVPCSLPVPHMQRILKTYQVSVWLSTLLTLVISGFVFYLSAKIHKFEESFTFKSVLNCLCHSLAILLGVSVPELPKTRVLRIFFFIYVCYCFSISTVFQAFFTSYLVEPGYGKPLRTFEDLLNSGFTFGFLDALTAVTATIDINEIYLFKERETIDDFENATIRIITKGDLSMVSATQYSIFIANKMGIDDISKTICFLDDDILTLKLATALPKGSPFLRSLNHYIMRGFEAGFLQKYWSLFTQSLILANRGQFKNVSSDYLVLNLSHLSPAFMVLLMGFPLSFIVFLLEIFLSFFQNMMSRTVVQ
ncbi:Ionotropic receptor 594 [Blattella germanica]|nr:Ionotropic receptor 594 [Blattella germanica]